ncbi:hypothetical protein GCM10009830_16610 [Glycomyces endophyticus]|uniref:Uncharacterized protein n=1 Tax=Glycomyces endophyticus TaxID=480996 RepID=A0ABN2GHA5_9ACTN
MNRSVRIVTGLIAAIVLAFSSVLLVQAPAQAGNPTMTFCMWVLNEDGYLELHCYTIEVPVAGPRKWWPPECWVCLPSFRFEDYAVNPADRVDFVDQLGQGQILLAQASLTKDEKLAEELRTEAAGVFYSAAKLVEKGGEVSYKEFAWVDPKSGKTYGDPQPEPNLAYGAALEAGIRYMQLAALDPEPQPNIEAAMKEFEAANAALAALAAG